MNNGRSIPFVKMEGIGNDFVVIDERVVGASFQMTEALARHIGDRHLGVGFDQLLVLGAPKGSEVADCRMDVWNTDGSRAEMCGNGIRAVALYVRENWERMPTDSLRIETLGGVKTVSFVGADQVRVDMGVPEFRSQFIAEDAAFLEVGMGNPHAAAVVSSLKNYPVDTSAPRVAALARFPAGANVEIIERVGDREIRVRVWERGAGFTLACGTGACAAAAAGVWNGVVKAPVTVHLPGGTLLVEWEGEGKPIFQTGPAREVFRGEWSVET